MFWGYEDQQRSWIYVDSLSFECGADLCTLTVETNDEIPTHVYIDDVWVSWGWPVTYFQISVGEGDHILAVDHDTYYFYTIYSLQFNDEDPVYYWNEVEVTMTDDSTLFAWYVMMEWF